MTLRCCLPQGLWVVGFRVIQEISLKSAALLRCVHAPARFFRNSLISLQGESALTALRSMHNFASHSQLHVGNFMILMNSD